MSDHSILATNIYDNIVTHERKLKRVTSPDMIRKEIFTTDGELQAFNVGRNYLAMLLNGNIDLCEVSEAVLEQKFDETLQVRCSRPLSKTSSDQMGCVLIDARLNFLSCLSPSAHLELWNDLKSTEVLPTQLLDLNSIFEKEGVWGDDDGKLDYVDDTTLSYQDGILAATSKRGRTWILQWNEVDRAFDVVRTFLDPAHNIFDGEQVKISASFQSGILISGSPSGTMLKVWEVFGESNNAVAVKSINPSFHEINEYVVLRWSSNGKHLLILLENGSFLVWGCLPSGNPVRNALMQRGINF
eukprot:TRINITY_DN4610_c0_g1_i7.p1 TRINITY_DN4610_c0_g1~~TRINITY_DN4610_c0_g1_i7.p1  ORF type:complete len:300 (+),score=52.48 TRINITY_DN4610_c0_g1_i7:2-901(+)